MEFGILGQQDTNSCMCMPIFNSLKRQFSGIHNPVERLCYIMKEQNLQCTKCNNYHGNSKNGEDKQNEETVLPELMSLQLLCLNMHIYNIIISLNSIQSQLFLLVYTNIIRIAHKE